MALLSFVAQSTALTALDTGEKAPPFANPDLDSRRVLSVVAPYFRQRPTPLTVLVDRYRVAVKKYGVSEIPALFLVNPEGLIVYKQVGYSEDLYDRIRTLLSD
jgi:hypothetical protein